MKDLIDLKRQALFFSLMACLPTFAPTFSNNPLYGAALDVLSTANVVSMNPIQGSMSQYTSGQYVTLDRPIPGTGSLSGRAIFKAGLRLNEFTPDHYPSEIIFDRISEIIGLSDTTPVVERVLRVEVMVNGVKEVRMIKGSLQALADITDPTFVLNELNYGTQNLGDLVFMYKLTADRDHAHKPYQGKMTSHNVMFLDDGRVMSYDHARAFNYNTPADSSLNYFGELDTFFEYQFEDEFGGKAPNPSLKFKTMLQSADRSAIQEVFNSFKMYDEAAIFFKRLDIFLQRYKFGNNIKYTLTEALKDALDNPGKSLPTAQARADTRYITVNVAMDRADIEALISDDPPFPGQKNMRVVQSASEGLPPNGEIIVQTTVRADRSTLLPDRKWQITDDELRRALTKDGNVKADLRISEADPVGSLGRIKSVTEILKIVPTTGSPGEGMMNTISTITRQSQGSGAGPIEGALSMDSVLASRVLAAARAVDSGLIISRTAAPTGFIVFEDGTVVDVRGGLTRPTISELAAQAPSGTTPRIGVYADPGTDLGQSLMLEARASGAVDNPILSQDLAGNSGQAGEIAKRNFASAVVENQMDVTQQKYFSLSEGGAREVGATGPLLTPSELQGKSNLFEVARVELNNRSGRGALVMAFPLTDPSSTTGAVRSGLTELRVSANEHLLKAASSPYFMGVLAAIDSTAQQAGLEGELFNQYMTSHDPNYLEEWNRQRESMGSNIAFNFGKSLYLQANFMIGFDALGSLVGPSVATAAGIVVGVGGAAVAAYSTANEYSKFSKSYQDLLNEEALTKLYDYETDWADSAAWAGARITPVVEAIDATLGAIKAGVLAATTPINGSFGSAGTFGTYSMNGDYTPKPVDNSQLHLNLPPALSFEAGYSPEMTERQLILAGQQILATSNKNIYDPIVVAFGSNRNEIYKVADSLSGDSSLLETLRANPITDKLTPDARLGSSQRDEFFAISATVRPENILSLTDSLTPAILPEARAMAQGSFLDQLESNQSLVASVNENSTMAIVDPNNLSSSSLFLDPIVPSGSDPALDDPAVMAFVNEFEMKLGEVANPNNPKWSYRYSISDLDSPLGPISSTLVTGSGPGSTQNPNLNSVQDGAQFLVPGDQYFCSLFLSDPACGGTAGLVTAQVTDASGNLVSGIDLPSSTGGSGGAVNTPILDSSWSDVYDGFDGFD